MEKCEFDWQFHEGRDADGDKFRTHILVHGSGRILARVVEPTHLGGFSFRVWFYCKVPKSMDSNEGYDFIDVESAKKFVEQTLSNFDPLAVSKPKRTVKPKQTQT